jgi:hypothetical protein
MGSTPAPTLDLSDLRARIAAVEQRIQSACDRCGRRRDEVTLLAVTKVFPAQAILDAYALGLREFGENYVQEFETKAPQVRSLAGARFHLIGHLQSNKSHKAAELFEVIQTVDSAKLAHRLAAEARPLEVMIEVKLSEEQTKHGCAPADLPALVDLIRSERSLALTGLMTMPPWSDDPEAARPCFQQLRALAKQVGVPGLSMGMSHDLEVAIQEGSTLVRVGTALFGSRRQDA